MSKQRTSGRLERRAERDARENRGAAAPRARRQRPVAKKVDSGGSSFLPGPLRNMSGTTLGISAIVLLVGIFLVYSLTQIGGGDSTPDYLQAQRYRRLLRRGLLDVFKHVDVLVCPTLPFTATRVGETTVVIEDGGGPSPGS